MGSDTAATPVEFTWEECQKLIGEMADCGIRNVMLTGGEPLVHPAFFRIVNAIAKEGMHVSRIYTNALKLTEETLFRLEEEKIFHNLVCDPADDQSALCSWV